MVRRTLRIVLDFPAKHALYIAYDIIVCDLRVLPGLPNVFVMFSNTPSGDLPDHL